MAIKVSEVLTKPPLHWPIWLEIVIPREFCDPRPIGLIWSSTQLKYLIYLFWLQESEGNRSNPGSSMPQRKISYKHAELLRHYEAHSMIPWLPQNGRRQTAVCQETKRNTSLIASTVNMRLLPQNNTITIHQEIYTLHISFALLIA